VVPFDTVLPEEAYQPLDVRYTGGLPAWMTHFFAEMDEDPALMEAEDRGLSLLPTTVEGMVEYIQGRVLKQGRVMKRYVRELAEVLLRQAKRGAVGCATRY